MTNQKPNKKWEKQTIKICSRVFDLYFDPNRTGGEFSSSWKGGRGAIIVGTKRKDLNHTLALLLHEAIEAILALDGKRYVDEDHEEHKILFTFDHHYLYEFVDKIIDALMSSGVIEKIDK